MKSKNQVLRRTRRPHPISIQAVRSNFMAKIHLLKIFVLALLVAAYAGSASATPITYVFTGTAAGCLGTFVVGDGTQCLGQSFEGATLTVTAVGDTNDVAFVGGIYRDNNVSTTITITGGDIEGTITVTVTPSAGNYDYVFDNPTPFPTPDVARIGYGVTGIQNPSDIIQFANAAYLTYNLTNSIGPISSPEDLSIGDWVGVPTDGGALTLTSYTNNTFSATIATSITLTLEPGVQAVYSFDNGANIYKITPSPFSTGGEVLKITEVPVLKSNFFPPANFPNETCIPVADYTAKNGADTCVEYQADCSFNGVPGGGDCNTLLYTVLDSFDLPPDLPAIGGPDFLVVHGSGCPTSSTAQAVSIFTDYFVTRIDPTIKGGGAGTGSCFEKMYTPGAPVITNGSVSRFGGWFSPLVDSDLNLVKAGSTRPLKFSWSDNLGNPITNLSYCNSFTATNSGNVCQDIPAVPTPWVNLASFGTKCPNGIAVNPVTDDPSISTAGSSGFQNFGDGSYQMNWKVPKAWKGYCANVQVTFDNGVYEVPAVIGFQFN